MEERNWVFTLRKRKFIIMFINEKKFYRFYNSDTTLYQRLKDYIPNNDLKILSSKSVKIWTDYKHKNKKLKVSVAIGSRFNVRRHINST